MPVLPLDYQAPPPESEPQVPTAKRFFWGLTAFASGIMNSFASLVNAVYIDALHYDPNMVSIAKSLPMYAAFGTGPAIGHLCDNTRSRWGRRKPWMLFGLIFTAGLGMVMWCVPASDNKWHWPMFFFIAAMIMLIGNIGGGAFGTAAGAMGFEMTTDYNERTHLFKWGSWMGALAGFVSPWLLNMCLWFEGSNRETTRGSVGVYYVWIIMIVMMMATGLPAILFCKEKVSDHVHEKKVSFFSGLGMTLHNGPFWLLVVSNLIMRFAMNITGFLFYWLLIYYLGQGNHTLGMNTRGVMYTTIAITAFFVTPAIAWLTSRIGKREALLVVLFLSAVAYASVGITFTDKSWSYLKLGRLITFQWPCLISAVLIGAFTNTMPMIKASMLADVCDYDELKFGHRREGFYGSVFGVCESIATAIAISLTGLTLKLSGFDSTLTQQSHHTMMIWLVAVAISQPAGFLVGMLSIFFYPLSRKRMIDIRAQIDARKQVATPGGPGFEVITPPG